MHTLGSGQLLLVSREVVNMFNSPCSSFSLVPCCIKRVALRQQISSAPTSVVFQFSPTPSFNGLRSCWTRPFVRILLCPNLRTLTCRSDFFSGNFCQRLCHKETVIKMNDVDLAVKLVQILSEWKNLIVYPSTENLRRIFPEKN